VKHKPVDEARLKRPAIWPPLAWLIGLIVAAAICFWPGGIALFAVAMWGGFSPNVSVLSKLLVLGLTVAVISGIVYLIARAIAKALAPPGSLDH